QIERCTHIMPSIRTTPDLGVGDTHRTSIARARGARGAQAAGTPWTMAQGNNGRDDDAGIIGPGVTSITYQCEERSYGGATFRAKWAEGAGRWHGHLAHLRRAGYCCRAEGKTDR